MGQSQEPALRSSHHMKELRPVDEASGVYLNICNNRMYVKNDLYISNIADIEYEYDVYNFRRLNDNYVVSVDYCNHSSSQHSCSYPSLSFYIEKQEYTLFDKEEMNKEETTRLLLHVLKGFEILYQRFGYFTPSSKLIFFNRFHHAKVWLNQNLKESKNIYFGKCSQSISLQDKFVREIVKIFDALRDPQDPMFCYSKCLPKTIMSFKTVREVFEANQLGNSCQNMRRCGSPFRQIQNIRRWASPIIERQTIANPTYASPPQASMSPRFRARDTCVPQRIQVEKPRMKINQISPMKKASCEKEGQLKDSVKYSLKRTNSGYMSKRNGSKQFTSTMPNSLRNSRVQDKLVIVDFLMPVVSSNRSASPVFSIPSSKKHQRFSECEPTSFGKQLSGYQQSSPRPYFDGFMEKQSPVKLEGLPLDESSIKTERSNTEYREQQKKSEASPRKEFMMHKRHKTDYKIHQTSLGPTSISSLNQKSAVGGTIGKFNINTIKSIHLLEEDRETDSSIITDLKQIINKYRLTEMSKKD